MIAKRGLDIGLSSFGLICASPVLLPTMFLVWWQDKHSPFYIATRVGKDGKPFRMFKLRSMIIAAEKTGVDSTAADDNRITAVGRFVRRYKLDELPQLWNVLKGEMSLVGPRPNVQRDVDLYTSTERGLLSVTPGITDFSSIVFSDEGEILRGSKDPNQRYNEIIRPWKSRLGLFYVQHRGVWLDIQLIIATVVAIVSKPHALQIVNRLLVKLGADDLLIRMSARKEELLPFHPPGAAPA